MLDIKSKIIIQLPNLTNMFISIHDGNWYIRWLLATKILF